MEYYEKTASEKLADEFYSELRSSMVNAADRPESYSIRERDIRRVNLERFPYHFLFRVAGDTVRILVIRHHHKRPDFGIRRH
jgi:plasmid stabilization system protein ParE